MLSAMFSSSSALKGMERSMEVVGNNLANANTTGFKASRATFEDALVTANGRAAPTGLMQVGHGVSVANVDQNLNQGTFETTEHSIDMAIGGKGFFVVNDKNGNSLYTRAGDFKMDITQANVNGGYQKKLVSNQGLVVQGYPLDKDGERTTTTVTDIDFAPTKYSQSFQITKNANVAVQLNSTETIIADDAGTTAWNETQFYAADPNTYNYSTTVRLYDSQGGGHNVEMYYKKTGDNTWDVYTNTTPLTPAFTDATGVGGANIAANKIAELAFTSAGELLSITTGDQPDRLTNTTTPINSTNSAQVTTSYNFAVEDAISTAANSTATAASNAVIAAGGSATLAAAAESAVLAGNGSAASAAAAEAAILAIDPTAAAAATAASAAVTGEITTITAGVSRLGAQTITFDFGNGAGTNTTQQLAGTSTTLNVSQDGFPVGYLDNFTVDEEGKLWGVYSNGEQKGLYQLAVASFNNDAGLRQNSANLFEETRESGAANVGFAESGGNGSILSYTLEQSNVNMSDEFIQMISTQRVFQANSRVVTTSDSLMDEVLNLKR
jgi:flagellar hook protein FlgE